MGWREERHGRKRLVLFRVLNSLHVQWPNISGPRSRVAVRRNSPVPGFVFWEILAARHRLFWHSVLLVVQPQPSHPHSAVIGIPRFSKFTLHHPAFTKKPTSVPVFTHWEKSAEDVGFYEKRRKVNMHSASALPWASMGAVHPEQWQRPHRAPSSGTTLGTRASQSFELLSVSICALSQFILSIC